MRAVPMDQMRDRGAAHRDAFRSAGRAGGEQHVGEFAELVRGQRRARIDSRLRIDPAQVARQARTVRGAADRETRTRVLDHRGNACCGEIEVERKIGGAAGNDTEHRDDRFGRARGRQRNDIVRLYTDVTQGGRSALHPGVQRCVVDFTRTGAQCQRGRCRGHLRKDRRK